MWTVIGNQYVYAYSIPAYRCPDEPTQTANGLSAAPCGAPINFGMAITRPTTWCSATQRNRALEGQATFASIRDGTSNTLFIAERYGTCGHDPTGNINNAYGNLWSDSTALGARLLYEHAGVRPGRRSAVADHSLPAMLAVSGYARPVARVRPGQAQSPHSGGMNVGVGDGSVRFISGSIQQQLWANLCDPRDGNSVGSDW